MFPSQGAFPSRESRVTLRHAFVTLSLAGGLTVTLTPLLSFFNYGPKMLLTPWDRLSEASAATYRVNSGCWSAFLDPEVEPTSKR